MRRLVRHLFTLCSAASLLVCVAACVLWVRSYRLMEAVDWRCAGGARWICTARGYLEAGVLVADWSRYPAEFHGPRYQRDVARPPVNYLGYLGGSWDDKDFDWQWHGFEWHHKRNPRQGVLHGLAIIPFWFIAAATALPPLGWTVLRFRSRARARRRANLGLCPTCGYDLRATPHRCPECGEAPKPESRNGSAASSYVQSSKSFKNRHVRKTNVPITSSTSARVSRRSLRRMR